MVGAVEVAGMGASAVHGRVHVGGLLVEALEQVAVAQLGAVRLVDVLDEPLAFQSPLVHLAEPPSSPADRVDSPEDGPACVPSLDASVAADHGEQQTDAQHVSGGRGTTGY
jgi:hypothetical protein